jgi:pantoate--beta-alanine ligase
MNVIRTIAEMRAALAPARQAGKRIGFVPTMGAFHAGHLSLMRRARELSDVTVVSLFVNPTQFNDPRDLERYPRDERRDVAMSSNEGMDWMFAPSADEMYGGGASTIVEVRGVSEPLEGASRGPAHFRGVATVVSKLFNIVQPDIAFFGQKDAQQVLVIKRMVRDLDIPVRIEVCPTVRESDGLALSSRNALLSSSARQHALALHRALSAAEQAVARGERDTAKVLGMARAAMSTFEVEPEYLEAVSTDTLRPVSRIDGETLLAVAARVGGVRLIDNVVLRSEQSAERSS